MIDIIDLESLRISIVTTIDGVKAGINESKKLLTEFQKNDGLTQIKLKADTSSLGLIRQEIDRLLVLKEKLASEIELKLKDSGINEAKKKLSELEKELSQLQEKLSLSIEVTGDTKELERQINETEKALHALEKEIVLTVNDEGLSDLQQELEGVDKQLDRMGKAIDIEMNTDEVVNALEEVQGGMGDTQVAATDMANTIDAASVMSAASLAVIVKAIQSGVAAFASYTQVMAGLTAQMEHLGENMNEVRGIMGDITSDGLMSAQEAAATIQSLVRHGYELGETVQLMEAFKDIAVDNKAAHLEFGEAIVTTARGIQQGNSMLSDSVGLTRKFGQVYQEYADKLGVSVDSLSASSKRQVYMNYVLEESAAYTGRAAAAAEGLMGAQQRLGVTTTETARAFGESMAPVVELFADMLTGVLEVSGALVTNFPVFTRVLTLAAAGLLAYTLGTNLATVATTKLKLAMAALSLHPVVAVIALVVGAVASLGFAMAKARKEASDYQKSLDALSKASSRYNEILAEGINKQNQAEFTQLQNELDITAEKIEDVIRVAEQNIGITMSTYGIDEFIDEAQEAEVNAHALKNALRLLEEKPEMLENYFGVDVDTATLSVEDLKNMLLEARAASEKNKKSLEETTVVLEEIRRETVDYQEVLSSLENTYETLSKGEELSRDQLLELIKLHPQIASHIANTANWYETLEEAVMAESLASKEAAIAELNNNKSRLEALRSKVRAAIQLMEIELEVNGQVSAKTIANIEDVTQTTIQAMTDMKVGSTSALSGQLAAKVANRSVIDVAYDQLKTLDEAINEIDASINAMNHNFTKSFSAANRGATSQSKASQTETSELEKQLKLLEEKRKLEEMSSANYLLALEEIKKAYATTATESKEMDILIRPVYKGLQDSWLQEKQREIQKMLSAPDIDLSEIEAAYDRLIEEIDVRYADFTETQKERIIEVEELRLASILSYYKTIGAEESSIADEKIKTIERLAAYEKRWDGYKDKEGNESKYSIQSEIESIQQSIQVHRDRINEINAMDSGQSATYEAELKKRLEAVESYNYQIKLLQVDQIKEIQAAEEKHTADLLTALEKVQTEIIKREQQLLRERTAGIKQNYDDRIRYEEQMANAEIRILEGKISEIDRLLKEADRQEEKESYEDRVNRLEEQLKYEPDKENRYELQKEINRLTDAHNKEQARNKLQDERQGFQEEITVIKDNLAEKKDMLKEQMETEIAYQETAFKAYEAKLLREMNALKGQTEESLAELKSRYDRTLEEYQGSLEKQREKTKENNLTTQAEMEKNTDTILSNLSDRLNEFAVLGREAGDAWAREFLEEVNRAMRETNRGGASGRPGGAGGSGGDNFIGEEINSATKKPSIQMNFNTPVNDPLKMRQITADGFKKALSYYSEMKR